MLVSVLDLGSNSFHVLVADADEDGTVTPRLREREMLHLGSVVAEHGGIPDDERRRAIEVVAHLTELSRRAGAVHHLAVATSALRDAENGPVIIAEMAEAAGTDIRVLGGLDEARIAYLGARASVATDDDPMLVLDLGGGSLELAVGNGADIAWSTSTELGVSRLSTLLHYDPPSPAGLERIATRVREQLAPHLEILDDLAPRSVVAVGGTVRALARVIAASEHAWLPASLNRLRLSADQIAATRRQLTRMDHATRLRVPGMKSRRADRIHIAAEIVHRTVELLDIDHLEVSDWGLREGTILESIGVTSLPSPIEVRRSAVQRVRQSFVPQGEHAPHVTRLALRLFDDLTDVHRLDAIDRELLEHAGLLHDIGGALALRRQHVHGAYLVENAEMRGFTPGEIAMLTTLVRFHRSRGVDETYPAYAAMSPERQRRTERLLALLELADGMDRARDLAVRDVRARRRGDSVELALHGRGLNLARIELERRTALFERTYGLGLDVVDTL